MHFKLNNALLCVGALELRHISKAANPSTTQKACFGEELTAGARNNTIPKMIKFSYKDFSKSQN